MGLSSPSLQKYRHNVLVLGAMAIAALAGFACLGARSLWLDEGYSVTFARLSWGELWQVISRYEANGSLYHALLKCWMALGDSEFALRSLSVLASVASVAVVAAIAWRLLGARVAVFSAYLLVLNVLFMLHAREARFYALALLLASASCYCFVRSLESPHPRHWAGYVVTSTLAGYAHFLSVLVLLAQAASLAFLPRAKVPWKGLLTSAACIVLATVPLGVLLFANSPGHIYWDRPPHLSDAPLVLHEMAGRSRPLSLAYLLLGLLGLVRLWTAGMHTDPLSQSTRTWRNAFLLLWLALPIGAMFAVSQVKPLFVSRYFIVSLPPLVILVAVGLSSLRQLWQRSLALSAILLLSAKALSGGYAAPGPEDWRSAARYVISSAQQGDAAFFYSPYTRLPFDYYRRRLGADPQQLAYLYPTDLGVQTLVRRLPDPNDALPDSRAHRRLWLILSHDDSWLRLDTSRSLQARLASIYPVQQRWRFHGITVLLYHDEPAPPGA